MSIAENLARVRFWIEEECSKLSRNPQGITLIAVSKTHSIETLYEAYEAGQRDFGENKAQELAHKSERLPADIRWHFIGHLQSNKARRAAQHAYAIHTLENERQLAEISKAESVVEGFIQVNLARESQKSGIFAETLDTMVSHVLNCPQVRFRGLMTIGPPVNDPEEGRAIFRQLAKLNRKVGGSQLSMGMSHDYRIALQEGATHLRIGTAIFGNR